MSASTARIGRVLFGAAIATALSSGLAAASASAAPAAAEGRHCWIYTHSSSLCRYHCAQNNATAFDYDPATGCCTCFF
ncbi:MAG TPA: hypothetical protein VF092_05815 [Longimicrobium sp.]